MPRSPSPSPIQRVHLQLFSSDWEWLSAACRDQGFAPNVLIRNIIHKYVQDRKSHVTTSAITDLTNSESPEPTGE